MTTTRQARNARFQQGSAIFTCECCDRKTRETGTSCDWLCAQCEELSGLQNSVSDDGVEAVGEWGRNLARKLVATAIKRGSNETKIRTNFSGLLTALNV